MTPDSRTVRNPNAPILFVDDDPLMHDIMKEWLTEWNVTYALSAHEAMTIMSRDPHLIADDSAEAEGLGLKRK